MMVLTIRSLLMFDGVNTQSPGLAGFTKPLIVGGSYYETIYRKSYKMSR